jgi:BirA family biotin operon repressor/biotin-[acetyl-CoA-carboxylase] ligase
MLAVSVLLRPLEAGMPGTDSFGWLSLLAGVAMAKSLRDSGVAAALKWPNDVLISERKVCGILAEASTDGIVVIGAGVNLTLTEAQLPVPTAISMLIAGGNPDADAALAGYLVRLRELYGRLVRTGGDAQTSGVLQEVSEACSTLGQTVRVTLPGGEDLVGRAERLDADGRLVIDSNGRRTALSAGDVTHLRY